MTRRKSHDISVAEIESRLRGFVYDSQVSEANQIASHIGCSNISEDVEEREEEESDIRVARISHLTPILYVLAHAMAEGTVAYQRSLADDKDLPSDAWKITQRVFTQVAVNTLVGALAQLVDLGFIEVSKKKKWWLWKTR